MVSSITCITHDNQYQTKHHFTQALAQALEELGVPTQVLSLEGGKLDAAALKALRHTPPDFTFSFNCILPLPSGEFLWDLLDLPHVFWNLDPAIYVTDTLSSPRLHMPCVDAFDPQFLRSLGFHRSLFLPHGTHSQLTSPRETRPYEVVLMGSCYDHEALRLQWQKTLSPKEILVVEGAIALLQASPQLHFLQALTSLIQQEGLEPGSYDFSALCTFVDYFIRGWERFELLSSLSGVQVHVFGEVHEWTDYHSQGWERYLSSQSSLTWHPPVPYSEALEIMKKSRLCLNSSPQFAHGGHERIFQGLAQGCALLTNSNPFIEEAFSLETGVSTFLHPQKEEVREQIQHWLAHPSQLEEAVEAGQKCVVQHHSWKQRAQTLLTYLDKTRSSPLV